jgi:putative transposase
MVARAVRISFALHTQRRDLWQRRFWEHLIENDLERHIDYIHFNPVKHGYVNVVSEWPYSIFHRFVQQGIYPVDWAGSALGERVTAYGE